MLTRFITTSTVKNAPRRKFSKTAYRMEEQKKDEGDRPAHQLFNEEILDSDGEPLGYIKQTGKAKMEAIARGEKRYPHLGNLDENPILSGHFGTPDDPVIVPSVFDSRQVGCFGDPTTRPHPLRYHTVHREKPLVCIDCGQVFKIETPENDERIHRGGH